MEEQLRKLKLKKAMLFTQMISLSEISPKCYQDFGKLEADIMILEQKIIQETKNDIDGN